MVFVSVMKSTLGESVSAMWKEVAEPEWKMTVAAELITQRILFALGVGLAIVVSIYFIQLVF